MSRLTRDGTAGPASRDQVLRLKRGEENDYFPCSADHEKDWQPYPVDPSYSAENADHIYIHTYIQRYPCTDARPTTCVAPVDASRDFIYFLRTSSVGGGGGGGYAARLFLLFSFPCSADHERDWPPCKVVFSGWQPIR